MSPDPPLVSVVTPVYNGERFLAKTLDSVLAQDYPHVEYIVADGGSTDGTIALIEQRRARLRYFSGPDGGPADALHRGFLQARGEILAWLNADDVYMPGAVQTAAHYLARHPEVDIVYGEGYWIDEDDRTIGRYPTLPFDAKKLAHDCFICQPATFFRASAYRASGLDPQLNMSFDYDLWIRMAIRGLRFASIPQYLACTRMHAEALTIKRRDEVFRSSMVLLQRHYGYVPFSWVFGYTTYLADGRDQFFEPLQMSLANFLASLPAGLRCNQNQRLRYFCEWSAAPFRALWHRSRP